MSKYGSILAMLCLLISCGSNDDNQYQNEKCGCGDGKLSQPFKAAAGSVKITPDKEVNLGGFYTPRVSTGVHDDLYARCLILECPDGQRLAFVSLDLVGFIRYDVLLVKKELSIKGIINPDAVFLFSTHQ